MKPIDFIIPILCAIPLIGCTQVPKKSHQTKNPSNEMTNVEPQNLDSCVIAGGCFWCMDAVYRRMIGIVNVESGYSNGTVKNPTYKEVCNGNTGHAEVAKIYFDKTVTSYPQILEVFWRVHNPTTLNRQGNDVGTQYRSSIFTDQKDEIKIIESYISELNLKGTFKNDIVTTIEDNSVFYLAENYHHDYFNLNSNAPYCSFVIAPKVKKLMDSKSSFIKKINR